MGTVNFVVLTCVLRVATKKVVNLGGGVLATPMIVLACKIELMTIISRDISGLYRLL